jgi:photosystem II stability/assembly factor-like uncharacterized protein
MKRLVLVVLLGAFIVSPLQAQWFKGSAPQFPFGGTYVQGIHFINPDTGWAVGWARLVYKTVDGGRTWQPQPLPRVAPVNFYGVLFLNSQEGWVYGAGIYYPGPGVILHTTDGGQNWQEQVNPDPDNTLFAAAKVGNEVWIAGGNNEPDWKGLLLRSTNHGQTWVKTDLSQYGGFVGITVLSPTHIWLTGCMGTLLESQDVGQTWIDRSVPGAKVIFRNLYFGATEGFAGGNVTAALSPDTGAEFYSTTDNGQTWLLRKTWGKDLRNASMGYANGTVYIVGGDFTGSKGARILASTDGGASWTEVLKDTTYYDGSLNGFFQLDSTHMWAAGREFYYYQYTPSTNHRPVLEVAAYDSVAYGGTAYKVSYLAYDTDPGDRVTVTVTPPWLFVDTANSRIDGTVPTAMEGKTFSFRIVATDTHGDTTSYVSKPVRVDKASKVEEPSLPSEFSLGQNYPNPFNPTTTIEYSLPFEADVQLSICDVLGRDVAVFNQRRKPAGTYSVQWDGRDKRGRQLPSGIYFYRLRANHLELTRKLVIMQ